VLFLFVFSKQKFKKKSYFLEHLKPSSLLTSSSLLGITITLRSSLLFLGRELSLSEDFSSIIFLFSILQCNYRKQLGNLLNKLFYLYRSLVLAIGFLDFGLQSNYFFVELGNLNRLLFQLEPLRQDDFF